MKIGIVRSNLAAAGGAERYALNLIGKLAELGHQPHVFTAALPWALPSGAVPHLFRPIVRRPRLPRFLRHAAFERWLRAELRQCPLDLLFTLERFWPSDVFRAGDGLHREWLKLCVQEAEGFKRWGMRWQPFHRRVLRAEAAIFQEQNTRLVICNSQMIATEIVRAYPYPRERIRVVPNGVDLEQFQPAGSRDRLRLREARGLQQDDLALLFVGTGFWRKGLDIAIDITAALHQQEPGRSMKLFVIGKGDTAEYARRAARHSITEKVVFAGAKPPGEVREWYQLADLLLFPTRYDPFANVCLEANACGLPVVTTARNGFSEHIRPGVNGIVLNPGDRPEVVAAAMRDFYAARPGSDTVRAAVVHLSLDSHIAALLAILEGFAG